MFRHYLTVAVRSFRRGPIAASVNIFALALGLTAFVMAYGVVTYWERSERHFANADRTYVVTAAFQGRDGQGRATPLPMTNRLYADYLRADFPEFEAVARAQIMYQETGVASGDAYTEMFVVGAESDFLEIFDLPFVAGDSTALSQPNSAVLTEEAAGRLFGAADPLGQTVTLANVLDVTVTGVVAPVPEPSHLGRAESSSLRFDVLASWDTLDGVQAAARARAARDPPAATQNQPPPNTPPPPENWLGGYCCTTYVLLSRDSNLTAETLNERLKAFGEAHIPLAQKEITTLTIGAVPITGLMTAQLNSQLLSGAPISITTLLLVLGTLVLVVACVNYANLATAQAARRAREVGLRKALGASRRRVMFQYLAESAVLTVAATLLSLVVVRLVIPVLRNAVGIDLGLSLFGGVGFWLFLAALLGAVALLGGAYPALVLSRVAPVHALRTGRSRIGPRFAGTILVGVQFAAASFLLIVVLVMYAQNDELERTGLGSTTDPLVVIANAPQFSGIDNDLLRAELERLPQVRGVSEVSTPPWSPIVNLLSVARTPDADTTTLTYLNAVGYDFFSTLGFTVLAGRGFDRDHGEDVFRGFNSAQRNEGRPINAVIDASLALKLGFDSPEAAVDQTFYIPDRFTRAFGGRAAAQLRVIGVVADKPLHLRGAGATSNVYWLQPGQPFQVVRIAANDVSGGLQAIDAVWKRLSPKITISRDFMDQLFDENYENFARINQVFGALALVAVSIALIGLFGMAVHVASRRVREIGVRKSVGARTSQIVVMLIRDFSKPVLIANLVAWPLGYFAAQQYLSVFMHRIPLTPVPFVLSLLLALAIAWIAVGGQAVRAARVSPANVLRVE